MGVPCLGISFGGLGQGVVGVMDLWFLITLHSFWAVFVTIEFYGFPLLVILLGILPFYNYLLSNGSPSKLAVLFMAFVVATDIYFDF